MIPNVVITDCNAASSYVRFLHPDQWRLINFDDVLAQTWTHPNDVGRYYQHKSRKCAEVLVPNQVPAQFVTGALVIDTPTRAQLTSSAPHLPVTVDPVLFFRPNP